METEVQSVTPVSDASPFPTTVVESTYSPIYDIKAEVGAALKDFYRYHVEGNLQIFHSLTMGEIIIAILLAAIVLILAAKWIWEAVRY